MKKLFKTFLVVSGLSLFLSLTSMATELKTESDYFDMWNSKYYEYSEDGFTDSELVKLSEMIHFDVNYGYEGYEFYLRELRDALASPFVPEDYHAGDSFLAALAWYSDTAKAVSGDGSFTLDELEYVFDQYSTEYIMALLSGHTPNSEPVSAGERIKMWKMLQKLTILKMEMANAELDAYPYSPREMKQIDFNDPWNAQHTITDAKDFQTRVIQASYERPVLVKFGLTYCIHCLLLENLGSVPMVAKKYADHADVYKLWWNPKNSEYDELNGVAYSQGVSSSPWFILYENGEIVKSAYAFPDENGDGMEEFFGY